MTTNFIQIFTDVFKIGYAFIKSTFLTFINIAFITCKHSVYVAHHFINGFSIDI